MSMSMSMSTIIPLCRSSHCVAGFLTHIGTEVLDAGTHSVCIQPCHGNVGFCFVTLVQGSKTWICLHLTLRVGLFIPEPKLSLNCPACSSLGTVGIGRSIIHEITY